MQREGGRGFSWKEVIMEVKKVIRLVSLSSVTSLLKPISATHKQITVSCSAVTFSKQWLLALEAPCPLLEPWIKPPS